MERTYKVNEDGSVLETINITRTRTLTAEQYKKLVAISRENAIKADLIATEMEAKVPEVDAKTNAQKEVKEEEIN